MGEDRFTRLFTVEEANGLLPRLRELFAEVARHRDAMRDRNLQVEEVLENAPADSGSRAASEYLAEAHGLYRSMEQIRELGVMLKDLDAGIMDFPCERGGELVFLCWHPREESVRYWHEVEDGYRGRRPISEL